MTVAQAVLEFFQSKGDVPGATEAEQLQCNYIAAELLDSLAMVEMISHMEKKFGIRFQPEDMQAEDFATIGGLVRLVSQKTGR